MSRIWVGRHDFIGSSRLVSDLIDHLLRQKSLAVIFKNQSIELSHSFDYLHGKAIDLRRRRNCDALTVQSNDMLVPRDDPGFDRRPKLLSFDAKR